MSTSLEAFLPTLRRRLGWYAPWTTFVGACSFVAGYGWGADDDPLEGFHPWLVARGSGRPELGWPWLVLCEIYPPDDLPSPRGFTEDQDRAAIAAMFDLLDEFYRWRGSTQ